MERLSQEFVERLNKADKKFFENHIQSILAVMDDDVWNFRKTGEMIEMGGRHNMIQINVYKFPVLTDDAIIGLLAHEFAHAKDIEKGLTGVLHSLLDWIVEKNLFGKREEVYQWNEDRIDEKVREMGFEDEIETLREENITVDFRLGDDFEPEEVESPQIKILELQCGNCEQIFGGKYHFNEFNPNPRLDQDITCNVELHYKGVYLGVYRSDTPVRPETFVDGIKCLKCGEDAMVLESITEDTVV